MSRPIVQKRGISTIVSIGDNNVQFPITPMEFSHQLITVDRDSYDDLDGNLYRPSILGVRDKFIFTLPPMYDESMNEVLSILNSHRIKIRYQDFYNPSIIRENIFYHGDLEKSQKIIYSDGTLWEGMSFNLISQYIRK